jgi:hypothetical protein
VTIEMLDNSAFVGHAYYPTVRPFDFKFEQC